MGWVGVVGRLWRAEWGEAGWGVSFAGVAAGVAAGAGRAGMLWIGGPLWRRVLMRDGGCWDVGGFGREDWCGCRAVA